MKKAIRDKKYSEYRVAAVDLFLADFLSMEEFQRVEKRMKDWRAVNDIDV